MTDGTDLSRAWFPLFVRGRGDCGCFAEPAKKKFSSSRGLHLVDAFLLVENCESFGIVLLFIRR